MSFFKPPIEIDAPDISPYRDGNTGIDYVWSFASDAPGPHVVIIGLTHGNEICGAIALDHLLRAGIRPIKGRLTFIFANVAAYQTFNRYDPSAARYLDEDLNRVWDRAVLDGPRTSSELQRARAILPVIDTADLLLDIHSMTHASVPLMLTGMEEKHLAFARRVGLPSLLVRDAGHASGPRLRDYARFADPALPTIALLAECGHHWSRDTVDVAIATTWRFLAASGVLTEHEAAQHRGPEAPPQQSVLVTHRITAESDAFRFTEDYRGLEVIARAGTIIARDGTKTIQTPYDDCVLIMPTRRFVRGQTAVRLGRFED